MILTNGLFTAEIGDDLTVHITKSGNELGWSGPWADQESAAAWAQLMIDDLANGIDHYGN